MLTRLSRRAMALLALPLFPMPARAQLIDPAIARQIDADVETLRQRQGVPSVVIAAIRDGRLIYTKSYGLRDREHGLPAHTDTFYEIGSITKQFTAAAILQLQEAGKLDIDQPLATYLPTAPHASEVTLRQLLTHTSGLHDYFDGPDAELDTLAARPITFDRLMARIADLPLDFPPGSRWSYSNTGYALLGKVIETVSGESYRAYLQRHMFDPLGMTRTFTVADEAHLRNMAVGYRHVGDQLKRELPVDITWAGPAGLIVSTLGDLAIWDAALPSGKVVAPASYDAMVTPFMTSASGSAGYGLGMFVDSAYDQPRIGHTGGSLGFTTADEYFPRQHLRLIAFTNSGDRSPEPGEVVTNALFADLEPELARTATRSAPGEDKSVTEVVQATFVELQTGRGYAHFGANLGAKLAGGIGAKFVGELGPYGAPTGLVFKGRRAGAGGEWYDYVLRLGPGLFLKYGVRLDDTGKVAGFSLG
jgi:D-alanyl-D-alanine carboxypeptidase